MTELCNFDIKASKLSRPIRRSIKSESIDVEVEMVDIISCCKYEKLIEISPNNSKISDGILDFTNDFSGLFPTDKSLSGFIHLYISPYTYEGFNTIDHNDIKESLLNLLISVVRENINFQLNPDKSNDLQLEKEQR